MIMKTDLLYKKRRSNMFVWTIRLKRSKSKSLRRSQRKKIKKIYFLKIATDIFKRIKL